MTSSRIQINVKEPETSFFNDLELISLVKSHDFIFDHNHKDYRNLGKRQICWDSIGRKLNKHSIICQRRWKALRERFGVHYKKFLKTQLPSTWENYTSLEFLSPFIDLKEKSSSTYEEYMEVDCSLLKNEGFDEFYFISLIREKRNIYDKSHEHFRNSAVRKRTWLDIGKKVNQTGSYCQHRWRVLRDRFVRDLRKSKEIEPNSKRSNFFYNMMFLINHVKSKNYVAELREDDGSQSQDQIYEECDETEKEEQQQNITSEHNESIFEYEDPVVLETSEFEKDEILYEEPIEETFEEPKSPTEETSEHEEYTIETLNQSQETVVEPEIEESEFVEDSELGSESQVFPKSEPQDEIQYDHYDVSIINNTNIEPSISTSPNPRKRKLETSKTSQETPPEHNNRDFDEDFAFGNMLACMLQKIPKKLKTQVKLKLLQSLSEFEMEHDL